MQNQTEASNQIVKTRHKDKNFRQTAIMMREGTLEDSSYINMDSPITIALLKAQVEKSLKNFTPNSKRLLREYLFENKKLDIRVETIIFQQFECEACLTKQESDFLEGLKTWNLTVEERNKKTQEVLNRLLEASRKNLNRLKDKGCFESLKKK